MEQHLYELLRQCTVRISVPGKAGHGTGFFVGRGLILTCAHVIKTALDTTPIEIYWRGCSYKTRISKLQQESDLALLQIVKVDLVDHPCVYLDQEALPFDSLYSYGYSDDYASGDPATFTLEGKAGEKGEQFKLKTGQVRPGMSGAPLLNMRTSCVCGIMQLTRDRSTDLGGRAISTTTIFQAFPELAAHQQQFHQQNKIWVGALWETVARAKYLEGMLRRYSSVTLPLGPAQGFSLNAIFQPLALRYDPMAQERLEQRKRRSLLGEPVSDGELLPSQPLMAKMGDEALQKTPKGRLIVLGGPGSGKTTMLKYLVGDRVQQALSASTSVIPIFISLPDFARSSKPLSRYLVDLVEDMGVEDRYADLLWQEIEAGNAFICMDGLDEVEPLRRPRIIALLNDWGSRAGNTWIIGSRFTEYKGGQFAQAQFAEWELMPLNHGLRLQLAERLLPELYRLLSGDHNTSPQTAETFVATLEQHSQAATWGENPLLFSLAAVVFMQTGDLPSSRTILYRQVIEAVIETREANPIWRRLLLRTLSELALWLQQTRGRTFSSEELFTFFVNVQGKPVEETSDLTYRMVSSGIMDVVARETYGFRHQSFQEYLAAVELARRLTSRDTPTCDEAWKLAWSKHTYSRWVEVLRLMLGELVNNGTAGRTMALSWLRALLKQREAEDGDPGGLALELAVTSLIEVAGMPEWQSPKSIKLNEHIVSTWIQATLDSPTQIHIEIVAQELSRLPEPLAKIVIENCLVVLSNQDEEKFQAITEILKRQGQRVPLQPLLDALQTGRAQTRIAALRILAAQGGRLPLAPLLAALFEGGWGGSEAAAEVLIAQGERVPVEPLIQAFQETGSFSVGHVLENMAERVPLEPFLRYLLDDDYFSLSHSYLIVACRIVISQKERLRPETWLEILRNLNANSVTTVIELLGEHIPITVDALIDLLQDENEYTRRAAAELLGKQVTALPRQKILDIMQHWDGRVRKIILDALYMQSGYVSVEFLLEALQDRNPWICGAAMAALGKDSPQEVLIEGLHHEHEAIRQGAIKAIAAQGIEANVMLVVPALQDHSSLVRSEAVKTLGILGGKGVAVPSTWVLTALHETDPLVQSAAEKAFKAIGEHLPLEFLILALQDGDMVVEHYAYEVLQAIRGQIAAETLLEQIQKQKNCADLHCAAIYILGVQGEQCPVDVMFPSLRDAHTSVRRAAVEVLGMQQRRLLGEALLTALRDDDGGVRYATAQVLQLLGKNAPVEGVFIALNDHDYKIRRIAAEMCKIRELHVPVEAMISVLKSVDSLATFTDDRVSVRIPVIEALAQREEEQVEVALASVLLNDYDGTTRHAAAQALCRRWGPPTEERLDPILELLQDEDMYQRRAALEILRVYGEQAEAVSIEVFLDVLHEEQEENVRSAAFDALLAQGERVPPGIMQDVLQVGGLHARAQVLKAFVAKGASVPLSLLQDALQDRDVMFEGEVIAQVLEMQGAQLPVDVLLQALRSKSEEIEEAAVCVLKARKKHALAELLRTHIQDEDQQFQSCVLEILAAYGEPLPAELLMAALNKTTYRSESCKRIVRALVAQGKRIPLALLLPELYHRGSHIRQSALVVLRALKMPVPLETLLLLLADEDMKVVRIAALMLYELYPDRMKSIFAEAAAIVQGQSSGTFLTSITQRFIAAFIRWIGYPAPEFLDKLTELLRWPHWLVRLEAIRALRQVRRNIPDEAIRLLLRLRCDPDPLLQVIRDAAEGALAEILSLESGIEDALL